MSHYHRNLQLTVLGLSLTACGCSALAAQSVRVELNKLEPQDNACRVYLVFENQTAQSFSGLTLDLVMFDQEGIISKRLAVNAAPLPANKTSVKLFDIEEVACSDIGRILINDALDCHNTSGTVQDCVTLIKPSSRGNVALNK